MNVNYMKSFSEFGSDADFAERYMKAVCGDYEDNAKLAMLRYSRGSVLIQNAAVQTKSEIEAAIADWR